MEIVVGAIALVFVLWWLAEEFQLARKTSRSASESSHGDRITNRHPATMRAPGATVKVKPCRSQP
jgi:hypothetical protein